MATAVRRFWFNGSPVFGFTSKRGKLLAGNVHPYPVSHAKNEGCGIQLNLKAVDLPRNHEAWLLQIFGTVATWRSEITAQPEELHKCVLTCLFVFGALRRVAQR